MEEFEFSTKVEPVRTWLDLLTRLNTGSTLGHTRLKVIRTWVEPGFEPVLLLLLVIIILTIIIIIVVIAFIVFIKIIIVMIIIIIIIVIISSGNTNL